jgi:hypothetical protein
LRAGVVLVSFSDGRPNKEDWCRTRSGTRKGA